MWPWILTLYVDRVLWKVQGKVVDAEEALMSENAPEVTCTGVCR